MKNNKPTNQPDQPAPDNEQERERTLFVGSRKALFGGLLATAIALGSQWFIGQVYSGYEARQLLQGATSSSLYLGSSIVTASATIIALMLTMISLSKRSNSQFDSIFFRRIQRIGLLSTIALIAGILLLLFLSIPLQESDNVPTAYFKVIYYVLITYVGALSGLLVAIVLMLLNAINSLIDIVRPDDDSEPIDQVQT